jgi:hypothetical protein
MASNRGDSILNCESPALAGLSEERMMGLEPTTFCMAISQSCGSLTRETCS